VYCTSRSKHAIRPGIGLESDFCLPHLHSTPPLGGSPSEYRHDVCNGKTRMVWLPDGEKILKTCLFVLTKCTNVTDTHTDRQTPHDSIGRACIASRGKTVVKRISDTKYFSNIPIFQGISGTLVTVHSKHHRRRCCHHFIAARCYASAAYAVIRCLSVCPSCPSVHPSCS